jgi:hypothetical protein
MENSQQIRQQVTNTQDEIRIVITEFLDFAHRLVFRKNETFRKRDLFPFSGEEGPRDLYSIYYSLVS